MTEHDRPVGRSLEDFESPTPLGPDGVEAGSVLAGFDSSGLLRWGNRRLRPLPWRSVRDPWAILASEVMLQQTQAARVEPKWEEFLRRWPTPVACARAPLADVLLVWQGLGYPRRARSLWSCAREIVERFDGNVPSDPGALRSLPGIGAYTSRAVAVFAFEAEVGVVDTNIARVLARQAGRRLTPRQAQMLADELVPAGSSWLHNQSIMEVGSVLCRPTPRCDECPIAMSCAWRGAGRPDPDPAVGSAGVSGRQAAFEGSDRQARGRILHALGGGPREESELILASGLRAEPARARALLSGLAAEGLVSVVRRTDRYRLGS